ncbi:hypothetical protein SAMN05428988_0102 [Chitinophaga sp. YR573]|uniref:hypothetical protein n=1 Tax=Chitinophaga sp. YR573 TaxID=1881040 RepID=UPI0008C92F29|nr:hypothetical protein [Chitinophaga sp. YR573]SEV88402.1 hypothetical protein SAMN05428988_0102 [Chitinophaga sp. YR573]
MNKLFIAFLLFIPVLSFCQTSSIKGNVFWKYNDFLGNRPDGGCDIYLYQVDGKFSQKTVCDVNGDFVYEGLEKGKYVLMTISKTVKKNCYDNLMMSLLYKDYLEKVELYDYKGLEESIKEFKEKNVAYEQELLISNNSDGSKMSKKDIRKLSSKIDGDKKNLDKMAIDLFGKLITNSFATKLKITNGYLENYPVISEYSGIDIEIVKVEEGKTINIVVDYGNTYM